MNIKKLLKEMGYFLVTTAYDKLDNTMVYIVEKNEHELALSESQIIELYKSEKFDF